MAHETFRYLLQQTGLLICPAFWRDAQFYLALLAGLIVLAIIYFFFPMHSDVFMKGQWGLLLSLILWQPFGEELLFRGIVQGQLSQLSWGQRSWRSLSVANLLTSLAFVALHLVYHPTLWAVAIFFPSLVFGYFRERHRSLYPAFALHSLYNLGYLVTASLPA
jgi:membrane protease YdiL (CAAX protease family)